MNKLTLLIVLFYSCIFCEGQNLVPNGDFEQFDLCPSSSNQFNLLTLWINPATGVPFVSGTPDYFNQCANCCTVSVPDNYVGYQQAHSGVGYGGFFSWYLTYPDAREYIEVPLTSTLIANECYQFSMYLNLANESQYTTDNVSVFLSDNLVAGIGDYYPLPFTPQIANISGFVSDTLNWIQVSGSFTALGTEAYLIIGNYNSFVNTDTMLVNNNATYPIVYFNIDDVSLIQVPCNTGMSGTKPIGMFSIYPNPLNNKLNIDLITNQLSEIILYDISSRKMLQQSFTNSISINTEQLAKGLYLYEIKNKQGIIKQGKVVKN